MGGGDFGGNGSVAWKVEVDDARSSEDKPHPDPGGKGRFQRGVDQAPGSEPGKSFEISIEPPDGMTPDEFIAVFPGLLRKAAGRVEFDLVIEPNNPDQIQIRWGRHIGLVRTGRGRVRTQVRSLRQAAERALRQTGKRGR